MKKVWKWIKGIGDKIWKWIKRIRKITILIFIWLGICFIIYQQKLNVSDRIQSVTIVTLLFITGIYAYLTHKIVKEAEKKRRVDYWERRIIEFYKPFIDKLNTMRREIKIDTLGKKITEEISKDTQDFLWEKRYMVSKDTYEKINELHTKLFMAYIDVDVSDVEDTKELLKEFRKAESEVRDIIIKEWNIIEDSIRKIYGY